MQVQEYVIQMDFLDRLGLGYDILEVFKNRKINLLGLEAKANKELMVKFECQAQEVEQLMERLREVDGILSLHLRDQMPYEQREHQLTTILNSVSEGIIAVDKGARITHINDVACDIFHFRKHEVVGTRVDELFPVRIPILDTLRTGKSYNLKEIKIKKERKIIHYLTSGVPILNEKGQVIGAVASIKDYRQVEEIISKVDRKNKLTTFEDIIYQSSIMRQLVDTSKMVARGNSTILLRGESGTGKELFARSIHMESNRSRSPFIAVNCAALPETLLESELFGYEEGTFTGASKGGKKGLFEQADTGTLFLDEIGEISPHMQVRLLRVLQECTIRKIGGTSEIPVDVRIIAATHRNLEEMINKNLFREDLYYRLNVIPLRIPPLRERPEDIPLITQHLVRKICAKLNKSEVRLTRESIDFLIIQSWPGNVRQLENTLERIINVVDSEEIMLKHLIEWGSLPMVQQTADHNNSRDDQLEIKIPLGNDWPSLKDIVNQVEKEVLMRVLTSHKSSRKAGNVLGVSNTTILNKIKALGIQNQDTI